MPLVSISSSNRFDGRTGKFAGGVEVFGSKKTLYAPGFDDVNVKALFPPAAIDTGAEGDGERTVIASGEKNKVALSLWAENVTVSPWTAGTELWLGTRTPSFFEMVISVLAMGATLLQLLGFVQRALCLRLVQRCLESWVGA
jgi:hypothetical protein